VNAARASREWDERWAQWEKAERYETFSPLQATEEFCQCVVDALFEQNVDSCVQRSLGENTCAGVNQLWRARQWADYCGASYALFAKEVVAEVTRKLSDGRGIKAADIERAATTISKEKMNSED
jgi:hypothetical protein